MEFNVKEFRNYSQFGNIESMDEVIYAYKNVLEADRVATSTIELLLYLGGHSLMIPGVSWKKQATIAEALGYSIRTVGNGIKKLAEYGMIVKHRTISNWKTSEGGAKKRQGVNVIAIQAFMPSKNTDHDCASTEAVEANEDKAETVENKSQPCSYNHSFIKDSNTLDTAKEQAGEPTADNVIKRSLKNAIPEVIYNALEPFYNGQGIYDTYGTLLRAKAAIDRTITLEMHADRYIDAFYNVIRLYKAGKVTKSLNGLLYTAWRNVSDKIAVQYERNIMYCYDWVNNEEEGMMPV